MEEAQQVKTKRRFPLNLYNRLEQRLKNKSEETPQNTEEAAGIQAEKPQKTEESSLIKCPKCGRMVDRARVVKKKYICYECGGYFRVKTNNRIRMVADAKSFEPWFEDMEVSNPLDYEGYEDKLAAAREKTGLKEAVTVGRCKVFGDEIVLGICDSRFMMASMGHTVGEKITRAVERAIKEKLPVVLFTCSGGARMQEGIVSLMQMAKTAAALKKHSEAGLLSIVVLTDPTTGGVTASFAMLGDIILGEPQALVGFAGPRVIEQTIGEKLPEGFQRSEFLQEHGWIDAVVERKKLKQTLFQLLHFHSVNRSSVHMGRDTIRLDERDRKLLKERKKQKKTRKNRYGNLSGLRRVCKKLPDQGD